MHYYDVKIFEAINGLANRWVIADALGIFLADYLPYLLGILVLSFFFWPKKDRMKNRSMVLVSIASGIVSRVIVKTAIVFFYPRPRPYIILSFAHKLISLSATDNFQAFPSGHAIFFFALSTAVYFYNKKLGIFFFFSSLVMGLARIFTGVHWPSDILGGLLFGAITAYGVQRFYLKYKKNIDAFVSFF